MKGAVTLDIKQVILPNGVKYTYYRKDDQTWMDVVCESILPQWESYCNEHWISPNHEDIFAPEKRVKAFLDRCGWLIISDTIRRGDDIESEYMRKKRQACEIVVNVEEPFVVNDEDNAKPCSRKRKKTQTKFERMEALSKRYPNAMMTWCYVDADNNFFYDGEHYHIRFGASEYFKFDDAKGVNAMDRILVVQDDDHFYWFDQNANALDASDISFC